eukprot:TRINITY_DN1851_c0_g1_i1.p2 TRINITY_DN1851_c0_g1~~TRINITY_DN1851_c0_g1_i1.p2  ORF type:complete len:486 (+),score=90.44 TRINITY_DN1851_c0_g1_i1:2221-3678(+)
MTHFESQATSCQEAPVPLKPQAGFPREYSNSKGRMEHSRRERRASPPRRRRRRPTLWDVREFPYGIPVPPAGGSTSFAPHVARLGQIPRVDANRAPIPGPSDIVHAPVEGETGPLAGINIDALKALLSPSGVQAVTPMAVNVNAPATTGEASMQSTRHARRLYVGNLPADTTDAQIEDFFNRALRASRGIESEGNAVISVYTNLEKRFAFIETRTIREAAAGLALDGVKFGDMFLRLRRPNDYNATLAGDPRPPDGFNPSILGIVSTQVSDGPNKVFVGGIPYNLTEDQIKNLLSSYGALAAFNLIKEPNTGMSKGFAFFEYVDAEVVDAACEGLHGMQVGDKTLTVRRATHTNGTATHASGMLTSLGMNGAGTVSKQLLLPDISRVVAVCDAVTEEELEDDDEYEEIVEDMREEAAKLGGVEEVLIVRPRDGERMRKAVGKVFVKFESKENAERALLTFDGRRFAERVVRTEYFDEARFDRRQF